MQAASDLDYKVLYEQSQAELASCTLLIVELQRQLAQLQKMIFGTKHERFVPGDPDSAQLSLGIEAEAVASCRVVDVKKISYTRTTTTAALAPLAHPGRMKLPEHLRREEIIIEPEADTTGLRRMGEEITEVLE